MKNLLCTTIAMLLPIAAASAADLKASPKASIAVTPVALNVSPSAYLPPVSSLTKDSDYTVFLRPDVPLEIHQAAMRKLWSTMKAELQPSDSAAF